MRRVAALCASAALSAASLAGSSAPAGATETDTAVLTCGAATYPVSGFGRGQVLFVTGSTQRFIVTFAQLDDGRVVFEAPGQAQNESVVTCTTSSPVTGRTFTFRGFFTPQG